MSSNQHRQSTARGRVDGPALLCGAVGLIVAVVMFWVGLLGKGDLRILNLLHQPVFRGGEPDILSTAALVVLTVLFCFGLAFALLDSPGTWRRVVLGFTVLVLVVAMVPTLAVWNVYFPPMMTLVGVFWTWFGSMIYVSHHQMPCDVLNSKLQESNTNVIVAPQPVVREKTVKKTDGAPTKKKAKQRKPADDFDKYKPKDEIDG